MKRILFFVSVLLSVSCSLTVIDGDCLSASSSGGIWGGLYDDGQSGGLEQVCYMTAFDYQKGYDWRLNQGKESVRCSLVVYKDGKPVMKVPVGEAYETGDDPDMHRIIDGHLYTDYSTDSETVVRRDGGLLFRYSGRESIFGMAVRGDDVYTLGQNRGGDGFSFRCNGEQLISRADGFVIGTLRMQDDTLSFAFYENIKSSAGDIGRYYVVNGGEVRQIAVRDDIRKVWDIAAGVEDIYLASVVGVDVPVLFVGDRMTALSLPQGAQLVSASLHGGQEVLCAEVLFRSGEELYVSVYMNGVLLKIFGAGMTISSMSLLENGLCCISNPKDRDSSGFIYRSGEVYDMPEGYSCVGSDAVSMVNGILHVGLSPLVSGRPVLWKDGQVDTLWINGYIASITVQ